MSFMKCDTLTLRSHSLKLQTSITTMTLQQSSFYAARRYATDVESNSVTDVFMAVK